MTKYRVFGARTFTEVAALLQEAGDCDITPQRVQQIEAQALAKLRRQTARLAREFDVPPHEMSEIFLEVLVDYFQPKPSIRSLF
jgi:DNA-directed RNA polymerase specialized sigma subunit